MPSIVSRISLLSFRSLPVYVLDVDPVFTILFANPKHTLACQKCLALQIPRDRIWQVASKIRGQLNPGVSYDDVSFLCFVFFDVFFFLALSEVALLICNVRPAESIIRCLPINVFG